MKCWSLGEILVNDEMPRVAGVKRSERPSIATLGGTPGHLILRVFTGT